MGNDRRCLTKKIVFSGDVGNGSADHQRSGLYGEADYIVMESTYGNRVHGEDIPDYVGDFTRILRETFQKGNVVIPSFAVGSTQEILYFISEIKEKNLLQGLSGFEVYVDSPLAIEATNVFNKNVEGCFDEEAMALVNAGNQSTGVPGTARQRLPVMNPDRSILIRNRK